MRRWLTRAAVVIGLAMGAALLVTYLRPVAIFTLVQRGLLRLSGVHSGFVTIGGHRIHYLDGGQGPPLVLLHGHPSRALEWAPLLRSLMKGHRIVAPDLLGYGESDAPDIQYAIPEQSAMVMDLLDSLRLAQVDLLGFSMGGWVALTLTRDHPERVRRLVLVGSGGLRFPTNVTPAFFVPTSLEQFRAIEQAQSGRRTPDFLARDLVRTSEARAWALLRSGTSLLSFRDALDGHLATIETPTLLIWGEGDRLIPYDVGQRMAHELPHARLVGLPGVRPFGAMGVRGSSAPRGAQLSPVMAWRGEAALCSLCAVVRPMRRDSEA